MHLSLLLKTGLHPASKILASQKFAQGLLIDGVRPFIEENKDNLAQAGLILLDMLYDGRERDRGRQGERIAIRAGAERWESDALHLVLLSEIQAALVGTTQQNLVLRAGVINRSHGVEDILCLHIARAGRHS